MAMYYYASKLNEASCSSSRCPMRVPPSPPAPKVPAPVPLPPAEQAPIVADPALLQAGNGLAYYDKDDYFTMVRGNKFVSESACQHIVMNGGINFVTSQKVDAQQIKPAKTPRVLPVVASDPDRPDIEYRDGQIITGKLEALIDMLRPGASQNFKFTFFLCSRLFLRPHVLLAKLCKRYFNSQDNLKEKGLEDTELQRLEKENMVTLAALLAEWTNMIPYDFRDDRVMVILRIMSERCSGEHMTEAQAEMSKTLEKLLKKLTALERYEDTITEVPRMSCADHLSQDDILSLGLTPVALATQLTLIELHRLAYVGPEEFLQAFVPRMPPLSYSAPSTSIQLHTDVSKCTRNLEAYADWFNRLSYLVASDILKSAKSKYRARVLEQWVMTARECFNLGNFNSLMAIIGALNMAPIARLKKTWSRTTPVCAQQLRQLELCVEPSGNHARYRAALAAAPSETAVPLLSVTCRDLHFANQSAPTKLAGNRVNFEKCSTLARFVDMHLAGRRLTGAGTPPAPPAEQHTVAWRFLNDRPTLTEKALEMTSFDRESPMDNVEKERLKRLRNSS